MTQRFSAARSAVKATLIGGLALFTVSFASASDMPGVTDTEIRIGNTTPYSGPASAYGTIAKTEQAYFDKINAEGGINGRQIVFISYDDAYSPPKTVERTRQLVERDEVLAVFQTLGTPANTAIHKYLNSRKVPHLFASSGAKAFTDPENFPWTFGWNPTLEGEGTIYGRYILENHADETVAVLYQNDDYGREVLEGLRIGLGDKADDMIVATASYETADPTVDSQVVTLKNSGATVFVNIATNKAAAQAIRKLHEIDWNPVHLLNSVANSVGAVLKPAGLDASQGIISAAYIKDPTDARWADSADMVEWNTFMDEYYPDGDKNSILTAYGYAAANTLVKVLEQAGDDLTRENVIRQAANLSDFEPPMLLPGVKVNTAPDDYGLIENMQLMKFNNGTWELFGDLY